MLCLQHFEEFRTASCGCVHQRGSVNLPVRFVELREQHVGYSHTSTRTASRASTATATHDLAKGYALCSVHGAIHLTLHSVCLPCLLVALLNQSDEIVVSFAVHAERSPFRILLEGVAPCYYLATALHVNGSVFRAPFLILLISGHALVELSH